MHQFLVIDETSDLNTYSRELSLFFKLYDLNFPDPDEREDPEIICNRIRMKGQGKFAPETTILLSTLDDKISGGAILEFYKKSGCFLLTYILVDEHVRGKNVARTLVESGIKKVIDSRKEEVNALFFESNIPWKTDKNRDSFDAWDRYRVFSKLGAKWIDIAYTQPSLGEGKCKVHNLHFFVFPEHTGLGDKIEVSVVTSFMHIFYQELGIEDPEADPDYQKMQSSILESSEGDFITLREIPHHEQNAFRFGDISIAYHFDQEPTENIEWLMTGDNSFCPVIHSYESDLFKYRYQNNPPYKTFNLSKFHGLKCRVIFPGMTTYLTEGRHERMKSRDQEIVVEVKLNYTCFSNKRKIWTVVMTPSEGEFLSQDQVIKFISLFSKSQEQNNIEKETRFICNDQHYRTLQEMVRGITKVESLKLLQSGIVQTDFCRSMNPFSGPEIWNEAINAISQISKNQVSAYQQLEKRYREEPLMEQVLNLVCGFSLGIFDYPRMSFEEVMDTIIPLSSSGNSTILMNKGILNSLNYKDETYLRTRSTAGICPYLLISSAVLSFNDVETSLAEKKLGDILGNKNESEKSLDDLKEQRQALEKTVNEDILPNVFHYPTEQNIFLRGMEHRGIDDRVRNVHNRLNELVQLIKDVVDKQKSKYDKMGLILLAVIYTLALEPVYSGIYRSVAESEGAFIWMKTDGVRWLVFLLILLVTTLIFRRYAMRSIKD